LKATLKRAHSKDFVTTANLNSPKALSGVEDQPTNSCQFVGPNPSTAAGLLMEACACYNVRHAGQADIQSGADFSVQPGL
jgi:hypothetical protein